MAKNKAPKPGDAARRDSAFQIQGDPNKSYERLLAEAALTPALLNGNTARLFTTPQVGKSEITELVAVIHDKAAKVLAGDLSGLEAMLTAQATALDAMFNELARRAAMNIGEYLNAADTYLRLALKAQSQCRTTIEAIAEIKNPRPVAFVKQANIAAAQQINNGVQPVEGSRAHGKSLSQSNELLELQHGQRLDIGTPSATGKINPELATVGKIDGAA